MWGWIADTGNAIENFAVNATTGNLTQNQRESIAKDSTSMLTECQKTPYDPTCTQLLKDNGQIVDLVAASDSVCDGVLNVPVVGCIKSWSRVALYAVGAVALLALLYGFISAIPAALVSRRSN